ncbi:MAG: NAD(P)-dependent oxidoreductase [Hungatella sp.]|nr:NAD(P)-dependent oxidoreductase [Hungatella sp.]
MRILITGASGFIGSYFMKFFGDRGYEVVGVIRNKENINREYRYIIGDLADGLNTSENFDVIIHCAAELDKYPKNIEKYIIGNINATQNILNYAKKWDIKKIINLNSVRCFGRIQEDTLSELSPIVDPGYYGMTKTIAERLLLDSDIPTISLILPGIIGKDGHTPWLMRVSRDLLQNNSIDCYQPDAMFNNVMHIQTLAENVKKLLEVKIEKNENILLGCRNLMSKYDVLCLLKKGLLSKSLIRIINSEDISFYLNIDKAKKMNLFLPTVEAELGKLIEELREDAKSRECR